MDCKDKLLRCQTYGEARKILETIKATPSQHKLTEIAFANPSSREVLLNTVIREQEGATDREDDKTPGEKDVDKKLKEEQLKTARDSDGSSDSTQPYPQEGTDGQVTDVKSAEGEDQMKENMMPPGAGGQPGMGGQPQMCPEVAQQMAPQMPQMPQMNTPQMMKQMHYTVTEAIRPIFKKVTKLEEAILAVDKKVQETQGWGSKSMELKIPYGSERTALPQSKPLTETEIMLQSQDLSRNKVRDLNDRRHQIAELDTFLSNNPYQ